MIKKFWKKVSSHKIIFGLLILFISAGVFSYTYRQQREQAPGYRLGTAERTTLVTSVSGSGQVNVAEQVDISPVLGGTVASLSVAKGDMVKAGALLASLAASEAARSVHEAQTALETARLDLEKTLEPTDTLTILGAENALAEMNESKQRAERNVLDAYDDAFTDLSNAFIDLPGVMVGIDAILFNNTINPQQNNIDSYDNMVRAYTDGIDFYKNAASQAYQKTRKAYDANFAHYSQTTRASSQQSIDAVLSETIATAREMTEAIKSIQSLLNFVEDTLTQKDRTVPAAVTSFQADLLSYASSANSALSSLASIQRTILTERESIVSLERNIEEQELSLAELRQDPDVLDIRSKELTIQQRQNSLMSAQQNYTDYFIRAPFDGVIAEVAARVGDSVGIGTVLMTLITEQQVAEIFLNEVDVAKVHVGQKVTITFDAIEELTTTGEVADIDTIGAATQGVVNYGVLITFDVQDERVKPGMSLAVNIITNSKPNVLVVPSAAIKSQGGNSYVEVMESGATVPTRTVVAVGLSNDTDTEIISGLSGDEQIVFQTISTGAMSGNAQPSGGAALFSIPGGGGFRR